MNPQGQQLLAHELAHLTQETGNTTPSLGRPLNPGLEQHADDVASRIVRGGSHADAPRPTGTVGAVHFKLATGVETITAQRVLDALPAGPLGAGPEAIALLDRLLRLSDIALAQLLPDVAERDPREAPPSRPTVGVEAETALDTLLRAAAGLSRGDRLRLLTAMRVARQPRRAPTASPKVTSPPPRPPQHREPGSRQRAREEQTFQQQLAAGTQDAAWNVAHRTSWPQIRQLVESQPETLAFLTRHDLAYVCVDMPQGHKDSIPPVLAVTAPDLATVRLHGHSAKSRSTDIHERFGYRHSDRELAEWAGSISRLAAGAATTHVLFNNCYRDYAQVNAQQLASLLAS